MEATAESMVYSPHEIRKTGIARLVGPRMTNMPQVFQSRGHTTFWDIAMATAVIAPKDIRKATNAIGPISRTPILIHKNEVLQIKPSRMKTIQCLSLILILIKDIKDVGQSMVAVSG
jgi:hypothetical protein